MLHTVYRLCVVCGQMSYCIGYSTARGDGVGRPMPLEKGGAAIFTRRARRIRESHQLRFLSFGPGVFLSFLIPVDL